jgi:hypothetical protein
LGAIWGYISYHIVKHCTGGPIWCSNLRKLGMGKGIRKGKQHRLMMTYIANIKHTTWVLELMRVYQGHSRQGYYSKTVS